MTLSRKKSIPELLRTLAGLPDSAFQNGEEEDCSTDQSLLWSLADGELDAETERETLEHLRGCGQCPRRLRDITAAIRTAGHEERWSLEKVRDLMRAKTPKQALGKKIEGDLGRAVRLGRSIVRFLKIGFDSFEPDLATAAVRGPEGSSISRERGPKAYRARFGKMELELRLEDRVGPIGGAVLVCSAAGETPSEWDDAKLEIFAELGAPPQAEALIESMPLADLPARFPLPPGRGKIQFLGEADGEPVTLLAWEIKE